MDNLIDKSYFTLPFDFMFTTVEANSSEMKPYDTFVLLNDLNSSIKKGQEGVILGIYDTDHFEVEFVKPDGTNFEFKGEFTFTVKTSQIQSN